MNEFSRPFLSTSFSIQNEIIMRKLLFASFVCLFSSQVNALSTQFCATISAGQADGAEGYIAMQIEQGK
jgi:hypothetical protein